MPSSKNIQDIKTNLLHPATTSHFYVQLDTTNPPAQYLNENGVKLDKEKLNLLCAEATLPGSNVATLELTSDHTGVTERHAYRRVYDDRIDLTFYVDVDNYLPIRFFETWIKWIANESKAVDKSIGAGLNTPEYNYRFKYRDDYAVDGLKITKFERSNYGSGIRGVKATPLTYGFVKAYPISISSMPISYDSSSLLKCMVSFTYMRYYVGEIENDNPSQNTSTPLQALTPEQTARINSVAFNPNTNLGLNYENLTTTGGVSLPTANSSGNTVKRAFSGVSLF